MIKDWTKLYTKYKGKWVALAKDEETVLASDIKLAGAINKAHKKGFDNPIMMRVPTEITTYVGSI